jgi:single-strand DNA-binding protein
MNNLRNKVQLIGHLGSAPEVKIFEGGKKLARLNIATNDYYRNSKGDKIVETCWHTVIAWGKAADIAEKYFTKGAEVVVEGKLVNRTFSDKEGVKRSITEIQALELLMLSKKSS